LMYSKIYLRLEPLGLELVAAAARRGGHEVELIDLQVETEADYFRLLDRWQPDAVAFSLNYLANVPEVLDLAKATRERPPGCFLFAGGHSASFTANEILRHGEGALDCVLRGEGEASIVLLLEAAGRRPTALEQVPGAVTGGRRGGPAAHLRAAPRRSAARARSAAPPAQVLYRPARPVRVDRVQPRLPVGLHLLQCVDLLR